MEPSLNQRLGIYVVNNFGGEEVRAYVPPPLPPAPAVKLDGLEALLGEAHLWLGRLDGLASVLPDLPLFIYAYVRKEAVLSSQIEGTQSSLSDLLLFESDAAPGVPIQDVQEVSNYVAALTHGLERMRGGFPLSLRLIREIHEVLLSRGRGSEKGPGEFRTSQNRIGGTRPGNALYVPPPADRVMELMGQLELFLHEEHNAMPLIVKAGLVHVQFETIHPFLDGNGRLGRLLITLLLCASGTLREPILYLSLFFKKNRRSYYDLLMRVRERGDWEAWTEFFLSGVRETSQQAVDAAKRILEVIESDRKKIEAAGRLSPSVMRVFREAQTQPILSIASMTEKLGVTFPTASAAIERLQRLGVLREVTGRRRTRLFAYDAYLKILSEGTEPLG